MNKEENKKMEKSTQIGVICIAILLIIAGAIAGAISIGEFKGKDGKEGVKGIQGIKGDTGIQGPKGDKGDRGVNASINKLPEISLATMTGDYVGIIPTYWNYCKYTYGISVLIDEPEDEIMKITFYYSDTSAGPWNEVSVFSGKDGKYSTTTSFTYSSYQGKKTIHWLVEAWDGSDISIGEYSYAITP